MKKAIMSGFGAPNIRVFESWLHALTYCRNLCAHHSRLWNRSFTIRMKAIKAWKPLLGDDGTRKFHGVAVLTTHLLGIVSPGSNWSGKLHTLFDEYPGVHVAEMGFPEGWEQEPFWRDAFAAEKDE